MFWSTIVPVKMEFYFIRSGSTVPLSIGPIIEHSSECIGSFFWQWHPECWTTNARLLLVCRLNIHTSIIGQDYGIASHTTVVCVNFIHERRDLQLNVVSERQIVLRNFSMAWFIYSQSFCQKSVERKSSKKYLFLYFVLKPGIGYERGLYVQ